MTQTVFIHFSLVQVIVKSIMVAQEDMHKLECLQPLLLLTTGYVTRKEIQVQVVQIQVHRHYT